MTDAIAKMKEEIEPTREERRRKQYVVCVVPYGEGRHPSTHRFNSKAAARAFLSWLQHSVYDEAGAGVDVQMIQDEAA